MPKTILTMDELVKFCEEQNFQHFSSSESGYELAVKIPATFEIDETDDSNQRGMLRLKYKLFHLGRNRNGSNVSRESGEESLPTIASRPVLAAIHQLDNGEWDFHSHDMEFVENEKGEKELQYIEKQVGSFSGFPDEQPYIEYDEETGKDFVFAYAYIPREYTKTAEIIERKGGSKNSVELHIEEMAYDAKEKYLDLKKFYVSGSTLLGSEPDGTEIEEGMLGSRADIADFKAEPQTFEENAELIKVLENLNNTLSRFNINDSLGKEEEEVKKKEIEDAVQETFDLSDPDTTVEETSGTDGETTTEDEGGNEEEPSAPSLGTDDDNVQDEETPQIIDDGSDAEALKKITYSITTVDGVNREFGLSVSEKMNAVYNMIAATYGAEDNEWYDVDLFEEDGYVEMYGWFTGKNYRQNCHFENDEFILDGERFEIFCKFVTKEELDALESMRANYAQMAEELKNYKEEPDKMEILNSDDYSKIANTKEFEEFKKQESHFTLSIEEVRAKADEILLDYAKHGQFSVQTEETPAETKTNFVSIPVQKAKPNRYGNLFSGTNSIEK